MHHLKRNPNREFVEVPYEWHTRQTDKAVFYPSYGWIPKIALRWKRGGLILPYCCGRSGMGDVFLMAKEFAEKKVTP